MKIKTHQTENGEVEIEEVAEARDVPLDELIDFREPEVDTRTAAGRRQRTHEAGRHVARMEGRSDDEFEVFLRNGKDFVDSAELRAQAEATGGAGGYLCPQGFATTLLAAAAAYDGIFDLATVVPTRTGGDYAYPLDDDTQQKAEIVAENGTSSTSADLVFDHILFGKTPNFRSGHLIFPTELADDIGFDLSTAIATPAGRRFARGVGAVHVTALLSQATSGLTTASATAITGDEILDLMASVDSAYGQNGTWLMNFTVFTALRKLKSSTGGAYLLPIDSDDAGRPTLFDKPVYLSPSMPAATAGLTPISFGDHSRFLRREAGAMMLRRYAERYAEKAQIAYEVFWRVDGQLAAPANSPAPVKLLTMHA